jgi:hypothetical protein
LGVTADMLKDPPPAAARMLRAFRPVLEREVFVPGGTRGPVRRWPLDDFFEGLDTAELEETCKSGRDPAIINDVAV